ncbi:hypothetical protein L486_02677 [Kwoniella mangroviensis CBS 10435]|uniref:B30.2/SPRY domain-containing protein n=1 Tax=Kwoniella mangroviensis CBS 10435 TaxID=1331196 RepID=A0A1B9IX55_9TREE|nr:hypothetical protein L486_02677 [Kwoniella mangroviensis CBS 10435]
MPPQRGHSPPVDPFPSLRRAGSSSSSNTPSYASIAARSSSHHTSTDQQQRSERSRRVSEFEDQLRERHTSRAWGAEDVDRQDNLDELNLNMNIHPEPEPEPIDIDPSPPWRSGSGHRSTAAFIGQAGPGVTSTPSGSAQNRTDVRSIADGARNPPQDEEGISTPPAAGPSRPSNRSPPSPSPNRTARTIPDPVPATRLAPMFTLEELLRTQPPRQNEPSISNANPNTTTRPTGQTVRAVLNDRRRRREMAYNFPWGMQMERALPSGAGAGAGAGADLEGDVDVVLNMLDDTTDPIVIPFPTDDRSVTRISTRPLDGSSAGAAPGTNPSQSITSFLRRQRRNPAPTRSNFQFAYDPDEVLPANYPGIEVEDDNLDEDSDEERWASRLRIHTFSDGGENEFDIDGPAPARAQNPGRSNLHRGGNNRRRRSFLERIGAPPDLRFPEEFEDSMDLLPTPRGRTEATRCEPTNKETAENVVPLIVSSKGITRPREEEQKGSSTSSSSPIRKKRRMGKITSDNLTPSSSSPSRSSYLSLSALPADTPLPSEFIAPLPRSHLAVSIYKSAAHSPRPLITFVGCNPTRRDDDATALHTTIPIPVACGIHYYEVEVINKGIEGFMSVGWVREGINLKRLVGWDKGSWGWHGDDGRSFEGSGRGENFSETWTTSDTVGCGINFLTGKAFFTKNGKMMGHRFSKLASGLHPAVGLRSVGESLAINFTGPFKFDIDSYVRSIKDDISLEVRSTKVVDIPRLVDQVASSSTTFDEEEVEVAKIKDENNPKSALAQALQRELKEIKFPPTDKQEQGSASESTQTVSDPVAKATSAFVLDYLQYNGHSTALSLLRTGMLNKSRQHRTTSTTNDATLKAQGEPAYTSKSTEEVRLSDFLSKEQAIKWLHTTMTQSFKNPIPTLLVRDLAGSHNFPVTVQASLEIYEFLHLLYLSTQSEQSSNDSALEKVLTKGRSIRIGMDAWSPDDRAVAEKAFGLMGQPKMLDDTFWKEKREEWLDGLVKALREMNNLNQVSQLEQAIRQTHVVLRTLAEQSPKSGAAFVNLKDVLKKSQNRQC